MPAETCLKLPINFLHREEVRRFVLAMGRRGASTRDASFFAFTIVLDFAGQAKDWRPLYSAPTGEVDWSREELGAIIASGAGWTHEAPAPLMEAALESRLLALEVREGISGLVCPLFNEWNPHLLPGFQSMQKKGQIASQEAKRRKDDPLVARQHREIMQRQAVLDLGELGEDVTPAEIEAAIAFVMQIDRAGGLPVRKTGDYATWMLAAGVRLLRERAPKEVERLLAFLIEARIDPTVPKGAEAVLQHIDKLWERSAY